MSKDDQYQLTDSGPENYERHRVPTVFGPLAERFLAIISLKDGDRVLDVACGTGIVARLATQEVGTTGQVTGVDLNPGMLKVAQANAPTSGAPLDWREGDAAALPCENESYDIVVCQQGLQFISDKPKALKEMHRVLVPGGRLAICSWSTIEHSPWNRAVSAGLARYVSEEAAAQPRAPFALGDETLLRTLITDAGFRNLEIQALTMHRQIAPAEESIPGYLASTPNAQVIEALADEVRTALISNISEALAEYRNEEGMLVPSVANIALAEK